MDLETKVAEAVTAELQRQAEASGGALTVGAPVEGRLEVRGSVDLESLAMALVGAVAGGP